nr:unnamed protein product [Digitaria exilis]
MDPKATQEWTSCEAEEFKALFAELWNEKSCDRMEALAKRFPAKSIQQLRDKHDEVFVDMLFGEINGEPSGDYVTSDWHDWYKLLEGGAHDSVMGPLADTSLSEPSKQLLFEAVADQEDTQKSHCKSSRKRRQIWTAEEHRQFLHGVNHLGRGEWKFISMYFVPSRTPAQLASHAQKYFNRINKNEMDDTRQRHSINDIRLVNHGMNITAHSHIGPGKGKGIASGSPSPILSEDIGILHGLTQEMPDLGQVSNSPSNIGGQMAHGNHVMESLQWEVSGTPSPREPGNVLLDQTRAENRVCLSCNRSIGAITKRRRVDNKRILSGVMKQFQIVPINRHNLHPTVPPF